MSVNDSNSFLSDIILIIFLKNTNGVQGQGSKLILNYQALFAGTSVPPKVTTVIFNGEVLCLNDPSPPPTITGGLKKKFERIFES